MAQLDMEAIKRAINNMTKEEMEEFSPPDTRPKGWLSIEEYLPMMYAIDISQGCSEYKVKYADGKEDTTCVSDHNTWYYYAKEIGITHWFNE